MNISKLIKKIDFRIEISRRLEASISTRFKLLVASFLFPILKYIGLKREIALKVKLKKFKKEFSFTITNIIAELAIFKEIFIDEVYNLNLSNAPEIIIDCGANVGIATIFFKLKYSEAKIYAFEADPKNTEKFKSNTTQFKDIFVYNYAIADKDGTARFYVHPESSSCSTLKKRPSDSSFIETECKSLDTIMNDLSLSKVDLLKFDIEGSEYDAFKNFKRLNEVKNLVGELHIGMCGCTKDEFLRLFYGFQVDLNRRKEKRYIVKIYR